MPDREIAVQNVSKFISNYSKSSVKPVNNHNTGVCLCISDYCKRRLSVFSELCPRGCSRLRWRGAWKKKKRKEKKPYLSWLLSAVRSGVRRMERSGESGRGLCVRGLSEVLKGEELRREEKDTPCLRISWTALSLRHNKTGLYEFNTGFKVWNMSVY